MMGRGAVVAVLGSSGFVGREVVRALTEAGATVRRVQSPRLATQARDAATLVAEAQQHGPTIHRLRGELDGADVVVNAAGIADAGSEADNALFGANALLPGLICAALSRDVRFVHVSSAAVQGRRPLLDESAVMAPFSPYSLSKALGEEVVRSMSEHAICFRPTSVQGSGRAVTASLIRLAKSPMASVAGCGDAASPQVLVQNVGAAIGFVALTSEKPPHVVLQPSEQVTTAGLLRVLGDKEPRHIPPRLARSVVRASAIVGRRLGVAAAMSRRLEVVWFGQGQRAGWLDDRWGAPVGVEGWDELR